MTATQIKVIGNFLTTYDTDLNYINAFQLYKKGKFVIEDYIKEGKGTIKTFINDFKIVRNIQKGQTRKLLSVAMDFIKGNRKIVVDDLAHAINEAGITHRNIVPYSLASKILFLHQPDKIFPNDVLARAAVSCRERTYLHYKPCLDKFISDNSNEISTTLKHVEKYAKIIEKNYPEIKNIEKVRHNRLVDKYLWTTGK